MKKKFALLLAISMMAMLLFSACNNGTTTSTNDDGQYVDNPDEQVTLKWILAGPGKQPLADDVWAEFNERLQEYLPNTTVEFEVVNMSEYTDRWNLLKTSGEQIDIAWGGWLTPFKDDVASDVYVPLSDILANDCQELYDSLPEWVWDKVSVDGEIYAVPNYQIMNDVRSGLEYYVEDEDILDLEKVQSTFEANDVMNAEQWAVIGEQLDALSAAGKLRQGWGYEGNLPLKGYELIAGTAVISQLDDSLEVSEQTDLEGYTSFNEAVRSWNEKGYVKNGIESMNQTELEAIEQSADGFALMVGQYMGSNANESRSAQVNHEINWVPLDNYFYVSSGVASTFNVVTQTSVNPVRAMKLLQIINSEEGAELYNLLVYGLEGQSYNLLDDGRIEGIGYEGGATADSPYGLSNWTVGNVFNGYVLAPETQELYDYRENEVNGQATPSPAMGFSFDQEPVATEVTNIQSIKDEYLNIFRWGAYEDYETRWQEYKDRLEQAGASTVRDEVQRQLDEFKATQSE